MVLKADLFPVRVSGAAKLPTARVFVSEDGRAVAWTGSQGRAQKAAELTEVSFAVTETNRKGQPIKWAVVTEGARWDCVKSGCGCGSPLRKLSTEEAFS